MDPDRLTLACATIPERDAGEAAGCRSALIGLGGVNGLPDGQRLVSFGLAGALRDDLACGTVLDAVRVVDGSGATLWEGEPLGVPGAVAATLLAADRVVDDPHERRTLAARTGADAADLESGVLAATGRLVGALRVVSDTPRRTLHGIWQGVSPEGPVDWSGLARAFVRSPAGVARAASDARTALRELEQAARSLRSEKTVRAA